MNLPNKLTIFRVVLIPFFVICMLCGAIYHDTVWGKYVSIAIFAIASLTDLLDGKIARKYNLVTNFGKFMDPLADKLLVCSALLCLCSPGIQIIPTWVVIIIIARDFIISGFRLVAAEKGVVIAASMWGKVKTTIQMMMVIICILDLPFGWYKIIELIFIYAALALTVISLIECIVKNKDVLSEKNNG